MNRKEFLKLFEKHCRELKAYHPRTFNVVDTTMKENITALSDEKRTCSMLCPFIAISLGINATLFLFNLGWLEIDDMKQYHYTAHYQNAIMYFTQRRNNTSLRLAQQMYKVYLKVKEE